MMSLSDMRAVSVSTAAAVTLSGCFSSPERPVYAQSPPQIDRCDVQTMSDLDTCREAIRSALHGKSGVSNPYGGKRS